MINIRAKKMTIMGIIITLVLACWIQTLTYKSRNESKINNQLVLADSLIEKGIYEEALVILNTLREKSLVKRDIITTKLENLYLEMGYINEFYSLISEQIKTNEASEEDYLLASENCYRNYRYKEAIRIIKEGIEKFDSCKLKDYYENIRYKTYRYFEYYDDVKGFSDGYAIVRLVDKWGYINKDCTLVIKPKFDVATSFSNGKALTIQNNTLAIISKKGFNIEVADYKASDVKALANNRGAVKIDNRWYLVNEKFNITDNSWQEIGSFYNGIVAIKDNNKWALRNRNGNLIIDYSENELVLNERQQCFINGVDFIRIGDQYYLIDLKGNRIVDNSYSNAKSFNEDSELAAVCKNNKWGFIDKNGSLVIEYIYDDANSFSNNVACVKYNGKWGYINKKNVMVIPAQYSDAKSFYSGLSFVKKDYKWYVIGLLEHKENS